MIRVRATPIRMLVAMIATVGIAACSGASATTGVRPRSMSEFRDTIEARAALLEQDRYDMISRCMARSGFEFVDQSGVRDANQIRVANFYGYTDALKGAIETNSSIDAEPGPAAVSNEYNLALTGSQDGGGVAGCRAEANAAIALDVLDPQIVTRLEQSLQAFGARPEVVEAIDQWTTCMGPYDGGFEFTQPDQAEIYLDRVWTAAASELGIARTERTPAEILPTLPPATSERLVSRLEEEEESLWEADSTCRVSSGFGALQDDMLAVVLADLPDDFWNVGG